MELESINFETGEWSSLSPRLPGLISGKPIGIYSKYQLVTLEGSNGK